MNSKKVSVIIPSFNRYSYLLNAISSIQNQTYDNYEIIVVNDGSTEDGYNSTELKNISKVIHIDIIHQTGVGQDQQLGIMVFLKQAETL